MPIATELPAENAFRLPDTHQAALLAARSGLQRLKVGWHAPGHPSHIRHSVIAALHARGLLITGPRRGRLTQTGRWYARTLARALEAQDQDSTGAL